MVGRFIKQQQVRALPDDQRQHQARLLAAGETLCLFVDFVALEPETAQIVAQFLLQLLRRQAGKMLERGFVRAQEFKLVLSKVAKLDAFRQANFTAQRL